MCIISWACLGIKNPAATSTQITSATPSSQVTSVIAVTHQTRRRSRSSTRQVCCSASGTPARLAASSFRSTRPSSFSFMDVGPFERRGGAGDAIQPGGERPWVREPADAADDVEPDVLQSVFDLFRAFAHLAQVIAQLRSVARDNLRKGGVVAGLAADHEQLFVKLH